MSNTIKYSEGSENLALNKGNWWIGIGDSNKGPTVESGYWNAINPPDGGYTVYLNKETNGPSIHSITSDENLISFTNKISGNNYTTVDECLVYYQTQDDKLCVNREYENIVTDGLVLNLDAGYAPSYPTSGTTWYDLSGNGNNGTLINGPTYSGGSISFDGTDDTTGNFGGNLSSSAFTLSFFINIPNPLNTYKRFISLGGYQSAIVIEGNLSVTFRVIGVDTSFYAPGRLILNEWMMGTFVYDNAYRISYINGKLAGKQFIGSGVSGILPLKINPASNRLLDTKVSLVSLYNRALTADEVLQNYNAQKGRFGL